MTAPGRCTVCHGKHLAADHWAAHFANLRKIRRDVRLAYLFAGLAIFLLCIARPALLLVEMMVKA